MGNEFEIVLDSHSVVDRVSVVIIEQNPRLILGMTQRALVLDRGRVVHEADSAALLDDPATLERWLAVSRG